MLIKYKNIVIILVYKRQFFKEKFDFESFLEIACFRFE